MANIKYVYSNSYDLPISLASLASSTAGVGRQSDVSGNISGFTDIQFHFLVTLGTSPTANKTIGFYLIRGDGNGNRTDGAQSTSGAFTVKTADQIYGIATDNTSNNPYSGSFMISNPGPEFGIAVVHDTAVNLNSTKSNHYLKFVGILPQSQ